MSEYEPGTVERRLREAAARLPKDTAAEWALDDNAFVGAPPTSPFEPVCLRPVGPSHCLGIVHTDTGRLVHVRAIENYLGDGRRDPSRSHYSVNGRKVTHAEYRRTLAGPGIS